MSSDINITPESVGCAKWIAIVIIAYMMLGTVEKGINRYYESKDCTVQTPLP